MDKDRIKQIDIWNGIIKCITDRQMTLTEMAEYTFGNHTASSVGRIAVRIEGMVESGIAKVSVVKGKLMFSFNMPTK